MYDDPNMPYRCPICLQRVSSCTISANGKFRTCGCMTCDCPAPHFEQESILESQYTPMIKWNNWVIAYRKEHLDWHKDNVCKGCLRDRNNCEYYDEEMINCPKAIYISD